MKKKTTAALIIFLLVFQYVNYAGFSTQVEAYGMNENILTDMKLTYKDTPNDIIASAIAGLVTQNPDLRVDLKKDLTLEYKYALPDGHSYADGDTYTFTLPPELELYTDVNGNLDGVGTFTATKADGIVVMTFNENIESDAGGVGADGTLRFWTSIAEGKINNSTEVPIEFNTGDKITLHIKPNVSSPISKDGNADSPANAKNISWKVDLNKDLNKVSGATFSDVIPTGLAYDDTVGVKVSHVAIGANGTIDEATTTVVPAGHYDVILPKSPDNKLEVTFKSVIDSTYRVEFNTKVTDAAKSSFKNTATFKGDNLLPITADKTVSFTLTPLLKKTSTYDSTTQKITWTIEYNYGEEVINPAYVIDLFDDTQKLDSDSIQVFPVVDGVAGSTTVASSTYALTYTDLTTDTAVTDSPTPTKVDGFKLAFNSSINSGYKIVYVTEPVAMVIKDDTIKNTVYSGGKKATHTQNIKQLFYSKTHSNVNYADRTIEWKVTLNGNKYELNTVSFTDIFPNGLKLVADSIEVTQTDIDLLVKPFVPAVTYTDTSPSTTTGFSFPLDSGKYSYVITYKTGFDYDDASYATLPILPSGYENTGLFKWKGPSDTDVQTKEFTSTFKPNGETINNGFKKGAYNAANKKITWEIGVNYNSKVMSNAKVVDILESVQRIDPASIVVREMTVNAAGGYSTLEPPLNNNTDYTVILPDPATDNKLTVTFVNTITKPYHITFTTTVDNQLIGTGEKTINNTAVFSGTDYLSKNVTAKATINNAGEYVYKQGTQNSTNKYLINWDLFINRGQSTVSTAKIVDIPDNQQIIITDSFKLYGTTVTSDGKVAINTNDVVDPADYNLIFTPAEDPTSFELQFKHTISKPYALVYQTFIDAESGTGISNKVDFTASGGSVSHSPSASKVNIQLSGGDGTGNVYKGDLKVIKIADGTTTRLEGAQFKLIRKSTNEQIEAVKTTDSNGEILYRDLRYGKYKLVEVQAPTDYLLNPLPAANEYEIVINAKGVTKEITVTNIKDPSVVAPTPTPSAPVVVPTPTPSAPVVAPTPTPSAPVVAPTPTPSAPVVAPTPTPSAPVVAPTPTPSAPAVVPTPTPSAPVVAPTPTPSAAPVPTETTKPIVPTPPIEKDKTTKGTPIEGTVEVPDDSVPKVGLPPTNGTVTVTPDGKWTFTPKPGYVGKDKFSIIVTYGNGEEEEFFFEIDVEEIPKGSIELTPNVSTLPKTGESSSLPLQLLGIFLLIAGITIRKQRLLFRRKQK